jgi:NAD-dependent DNA ligase
MPKNPQKSNQKVFIKEGFKRKIKGKKIVMTTTGPEKRKIMKELLEKCGAECKTTVSGKTDFLICNKKKPPKLTKKLKDAIKYKTPVIEYRDVFSQAQ